MDTTTHATTADTPALDPVQALRSIPAAAALADPAFADLVKSFLAELELRVGEQLGAGLTDAQLEEFEAICDYEAAHPESLDNGNGPAAAWLEANCPGFRQTTRKALEDLLAQTRALLDSRTSTRP